MAKKPRTYPADGAFDGGDHMRLEGEPLRGSPKVKKRKPVEPKEEITPAAERDYSPFSRGC